VRRTTSTRFTAGAGQAHYILLSLIVFSCWKTLSILHGDATCLAFVIRMGEVCLREVARRPKLRKGGAKLAGIRPSGRASAKGGNFIASMKNRKRRGVLGRPAKRRLRVRQPWRENLSSSIASLCLQKTLALEAHGFRRRIRAICGMLHFSLGLF
jgi:hypothetical protein